MSFPRFSGEEPCTSVPWELFFPEVDDPNPSHRRVLRALCDACPVLSMCRDHALRHEEYGFWAGMTAKDRRLVRRELRIPLESPKYHKVVGLAS